MQPHFDPMTTLATSLLQKFQAVCNGFMYNVRPIFTLALRVFQSVLLQSASGLLSGNDMSDSVVFSLGLPEFLLASLQEIGYETFAYPGRNHPAPAAGPRCTGASPDRNG